MLAWVNAQEIKQVLLNLVVNALESMDEGGTLAITHASHDGQIELIFKDTGCGMTADILENIFEPFFTRSRTGKGTGLGLSISHRIVTQHGGEITASSDGPGKGSTFKIRLPIQPPPTPSSRARTCRIPWKSSSNSAPRNGAAQGGVTWCQASIRKSITFSSEFSASAPSTPILLSFLNAVLQPPSAERIVSLEIRDPFNPKETPDDKLSIVDVKAHDERGRLYNIEMQMRGVPTYLDRVLYYWAVLHGEHLRGATITANCKRRSASASSTMCFFRRLPIITWIFSCAVRGITNWCSVPNKRCMCWSCRSSASERKNCASRWMPGYIS